MKFGLRTFARKHKAVTAMILCASAATALVAAYVHPRPVFGDGRVNVTCAETVILRKTDPLLTRASLTFSQDHSRYAYVLGRNGKSRVVFDGAEGPEYDAAGCWEDKPARLTYGTTPAFHIGITFSRDGSRVAYIASRAGKQFFVIDGAEGPEYDEVGTLGGGGGNPEYEYSRWFVAFSDDGRHCAYRANRDGKWLEVADGVEGKAYDEIEPYGPMFSKDGLHVAYSARRGQKWIPVIDGAEGPEYDELPCRGLRFSDDGKHLSYAARIGKEWFAVRDGVRGKSYDNIKWLTPYFIYSPDGKHLIYNAKRQGKCFFVVDGEDGPPYDNVFGPLFGPDGSLIAYGAEANPSQLVVTNGIEGKRYEDISNLIMSVDGTRIGYTAQDGGVFRAVIDGVEGPPYTEMTGGFSFSPDSRHAVYSALKRYDTYARCCGFLNRLVGRQVFNAHEVNKCLVVVDGVRGRGYDSIGEMGEFAFTPDGKHLMYVAMRGNERVLVVDGIEHPCPSASAPPATSNFRFTVNRNGDIIRVDAAITDR